MTPRPAGPAAERSDLRAAFLAVGIGGRDWGGSVEALLSSLRGESEELRWLEPEDLHLTITYLGDLAECRAATVVDAVRSIAVTATPPPVEVRGLGCFPDLASPRVLWAGVSRGAELEQLKRRIDRALAAEGFEPDRRSYRPHVTLARASTATARRRLRELVESSALGSLASFVAPDVSLFCRDPTGGSRYREVERLAIGGRGAR